MLVLELIVKLADFVSVRPLRHLYIRFAVRRRYARARPLGLGGGRWRSGWLGERRGAPPEFERSLFALPHFSAPHLAILVVTAEERVVAEAPRVVPHLLLADLVDENLDVPPVMHRRNFLDPAEELVVLVLHLADRFFETIDLVVFLDRHVYVGHAGTGGGAPHACRVMPAACRFMNTIRALSFYEKSASPVRRFRGRQPPIHPCRRANPLDRRVLHARRRLRPGQRQATSNRPSSRVTKRAAPVRRIPCRRGCIGGPLSCGGDDASAGHQRQRHHHPHQPRPLAGRPGDLAIRRKTRQRLLESRVRSRCRRARFARPASLVARPDAVAFG